MIAEASIGSVGVVLGGEIVGLQSENNGGELGVLVNELPRQEARWRTYERVREKNPESVKSEALSVRKQRRGEQCAQMNLACLLLLVNVQVRWCTADAGV